MIRPMLYYFLLFRLFVQSFIGLVWFVCVCVSICEWICKHTNLATVKCIYSHQFFFRLAFELNEEKKNFYIKTLTYEKSNYSFWNEKLGESEIEKKTFGTITKLKNRQKTMWHKIRCVTIYFYTFISSSISCYWIIL